MSDYANTLGQWFTPPWAAEALVERHFRHLSAADFVIEPTCGDGVFLDALPAGVPALGVELDPQLAERARARTGRSVIAGDFRTVPLNQRATAIIGNPPFQSEVIDGVLRRCFELLEPEGLAGFILPAYYLQTPSAVVRQAARWSLAVELLPRTLFPKLAKPLVFARFHKTQQRVLVGFALYEETHDIERMPEGPRQTLTRGRGSVWRTACGQALAELGGEAHLDAIYACVAPRRPTENPYWREKVRQTLQTHFRRTAPSRYAQPIAAAA